MSRKKWVIIFILLMTPVLLLGGAILGVYKNQKVLTQKALAAINEQFVGVLEIDNSYISPFSNFPYISIDLKGVRFFENKEKNTVPLYEAADLYLGFDIMDILRGQYHVKSIKIKDGHVDVIKYENGDINLLMAKNLKTSEENTGTSDEKFEFDLQELVLSGFGVSYIDKQTHQDILARIDLLTSKIRIAQDHMFFDIYSKLVLDIMQDNHSTFFSGKRMELDMEVDYNELTELLTVFPSKLKLEEALFTVEGTVDIDDDLHTDLKLYGEKPDFNVFAAFAPKEVAETLARYKNEGQIYFLGTVKGKAANGNTPALAVEFGCDNAFFVNTSAEKRVDDLRFAGFYTNGKERNLKTSELRLQHFHAKPEEGIFQGQLVIRNFEDPFIKVNLHADLDLGFLGDFFEIEGLQRLRGQVILDMDFDELIDMETPGQNLARLKEGMDSELTIKNLTFLVPGYPYPVTNANGHAVMEKGRIDLDRLNFTIADSDFEFRGTLSDFPALLHGFDVDVNISVEAASGTINIPQLLSYDSAMMTLSDEVISDFGMKLGFTANANDLLSFDYLPKGEFVIEDFYAKFKHYPHVLHDFDVQISVRDDELVVKDFMGEIDESDFHFSGVITNYSKWFQDVKTGDSSFDFELVSHHLNIKDLLSYKGENYLPDDYKDEELREVELKGRLDLRYDTVFRSADLRLDHLQAQLNVHPLKMEKFRGRMHYENGNLLVDGFGGKMGHSNFDINMAYFMGRDTLLRHRPNHFELNALALDLDALLNYDSKNTDPVAHADTFNIFELPFSDMRFVASVGKMNYHTYWLENVKADLRTTKHHYIHLDTLSLQVADGRLGMKGYFNGSDSSQIYFHSTMEADRLDIDQLMVKFDNFGQDVMINENLHGRVSGTIQSKFLIHPDLTPIVEKSEAQMDLTVYQGSLVNFTPLRAMSSYFKDKNLNMVRFDTLRNTFDLKEGVLHIPSMTINSSLGFIELSGKQGLDLNMDYFIRVPLGLVTQVGFRSLFGGKNKEEVDPDQEDDIMYRDNNRRVRFLNINVKGTPDDYQFSLGKERNRD